MSRTVRLLIDECPHASLVKVATDRFIRLTTRHTWA